MILDSYKEEDTFSFGEELGKKAVPGEIYALCGDLGVGKTVFTKGIALALGINAEITSPTYAYLNDYDGKLYHYDCYRLSSGEDAEALGLTEYFYGDGVCVVEWSENIADVLPDNCKRVKIEKINLNTRKITY